MKDIIATRRKELGYTQQQLAEKLNVSVRSFQNGKLVGGYPTHLC